MWAQRLRHSESHRYYWRFGGRAADRTLPEDHLCPSKVTRVKEREARTKTEAAGPSPADDYWGSSGRCHPGLTPASPKNWVEAALLCCWSS